MRRIAVVLLVLFVAACDQPLAPPAAEITGTWTGVSGGRTLQMNLQHAGSGVTGTGTLVDASVAPAATHALTIAGTYDGGTSQWGVLDLKLTSATASVISLRAIMSSSAFDGYVIGGPFADTTSMVLGKR